MDRYNFHYDADCGNSCMVKESGGEYVRYHDIKDTVPVTYDGTPETLPEPGKPVVVDRLQLVTVYDPKGAFGPQWINRRIGKWFEVSEGDKWAYVPDFS